MKDISYDILDLLEQYGPDAQGIQKALEEQERPEVLYALSPIRENLLDWYDWNPGEKALQAGADYGALTGVLLRGVREVSVWDPRDEDLEVIRRRYPKAEALRYLKELPEAGEGDYILIPELRKDLMPGGGEEALALLFEKLFRLLKPGGKLIAAGFNRIGLRWFAGAEADEECVPLSWRQIEGLTEKLGAGNVKHYYPVPDHRLPTAVYSDRRLPKKGELTNLSVAYDRPGYRYFSEEAGFDELCREGLFREFADSYLVIWEKS